MILTEDQKAALKKLSENALKKRLVFEDMEKMLRGEKTAVGDDPDLRLDVAGVKITYTIENHGSVGWMRHLAVSLANKPTRPHPLVVAVIARELGFTIGPDLKLTHRQIEMESPTWGRRVPHILESIDL